MGRIEHKYYAFEWDDAKNLSNQKKHGLSFETAVNAFFDEHCLTVTVGCVPRTDNDAITNHRCMECTLRSYSPRREDLL